MKLLMLQRIDLTRTVTQVVFVSGPISMSTHLAFAVNHGTAPLISQCKAANESLRVNLTFMESQLSPVQP